MKTTALLMTLSIALCAGQVAGRSPAPQEGETWPRDFISEHVSEPGESLESFLKREVAPALSAFTVSEKVEGCGLIGFDGHRYSVRLGTDYVQHGCAVHHRDLIDGHTSTGETIHSHPTTRVIRLSIRDRAWSNHYRTAMQPSALLRNAGKDGFSPEDFAGGPGWLVVGEKLMHQKGERLVRVVN